MDRDNREIVRAIEDNTRAIRQLTKLIEKALRPQIIVQPPSTTE